jgi:hypothetical protein
MKRNWVRKILGGLSFTTALFVFQACYGTLQDYDMDTLIEGTVKCKTTGQPVLGIQVSSDSPVQTQLTDAAGHFSFYRSWSNNIKISFDDVDFQANGAYYGKDTTIVNPSRSISLEIFLDKR